MRHAAETVRTTNFRGGTSNIEHDDRTRDEIVNAQILIMVPDVTVIPMVPYVAYCLIAEFCSLFGLFVPFGHFPQAPGEGVVVDSSVVKGRGLVTDVLVSWGKLKVGDIVLSGMEFGKVKS